MCTLWIHTCMLWTAALLSFSFEGSQLASFSLAMGSCSALGKCRSFSVGFSLFVWSALHQLQLHPHISNLKKVTCTVYVTLRCGLPSCHEKLLLTWLIIKTSYLLVESRLGCNVNGEMNILPFCYFKTNFPSTPKIVWCSTQTRACCAFVIINANRVHHVVL